MNEQHVALDGAGGVVSEASDRFGQVAGQVAGQLPTGSGPARPGQAPPETEIFVNGRARTVVVKELTFAQVVGLAFAVPPSGPNVLFTVTYLRGEGHKPEGLLVAGQTVKVKTGMQFNVSATDKS